MPDDEKKKAAPAASDDDPNIITRQFKEYDPETKKWVVKKQKLRVLKRPAPKPPADT